MRTPVLRAACCLALVCVAAPGTAAELKDCVKLTVKADGAASLANACGDRLNLIYCVDNPDSAKSCAKAPLGVTTLMPGAVEPILSYASDGAGPVYWAVCVYPEAPVNWKPGPDSGFACKKTCVMC
jgi:hypothetical protein